MKWVGLKLSVEMRQKGRQIKTNKMRSNKCACDTVYCYPQLAICCFASIPIDIAGFVLCNVLFAICIQMQFFLLLFTANRILPFLSLSLHVVCKPMQFIITNNGRRYSNHYGSHEHPTKYALYCRLSSENKQYSLNCYVFNYPPLKGIFHLDFAHRNSRPFITQPMHSTARRNIFHQMCAAISKNLPNPSWIGVVSINSKRAANAWNEAFSTPPETNSVTKTIDYHCWLYQRFQNK